MKCRLCSNESATLDVGGFCPACQKALMLGATQSTARRPTTAAPAAVKSAVAPSVPVGRQVWRVESTEAAPLTWPGHAAVTPGGEIVILDTPQDYRLLRLDRQGKRLDDWFTIPTGNGDGQVDDPQDLSIDSSGRVYVCDAANDRIAVWEADGTFARFLGSTGSGDGELAQPHGVAADDDGFVCIADTFNRRVQKLSGEGVVWWQVTDLGAHGRFMEPLAVALDRSQNCYVLDGRRPGIVKLSPDGAPLDSWPHKDQPGDLLADAADLQVADDGTLFVIDRSRLRVRRFSAAGRLTGVFEGTGGASFEGGGLALLDALLIVPDRLSDRVVCVTFDERGNG